MQKIFLVDEIEVFAEVLLTEAQRIFLLKLEDGFPSVQATGSSSGRTQVRS